MVDAAAADRLPQVSRLSTFLVDKSEAEMATTAAAADNLPQVSRLSTFLVEKSDAEMATTAAAADKLPQVSRLSSFLEKKDEAEFGSPPPPASATAPSDNLPQVSRLSTFLVEKSSGNSPDTTELGATAALQDQPVVDSRSSNPPPAPIAAPNDPSTSSQKSLATSTRRTSLPIVRRLSQFLLAKPATTDDVAPVKQAAAPAPKDEAQPTPVRRLSVFLKNTGLWQLPATKFGRKSAAEDNRGVEKGSSPARRSGRNRAGSNSQSGARRRSHLETDDENELSEYSVKEAPPSRKPRKEASPQAPAAKKASPMSRFARRMSLRSGSRKEDVRVEI
jgi:hypothetical protein